MASTAPSTIVVVVQPTPSLTPTSAIRRGSGKGVRMVRIHCSWSSSSSLAVSGSTAGLSSSPPAPPSTSSHSTPPGSSAPKASAASRAVGRPAGSGSTQRSSIRDSPQYVTSGAR
ncbi:hypothetical protein ABZW44_37685 [Streptomyces mirabilis]|uniref:hypothetical protein n=1 Tax=Streptomyces mirabilis TaxID=68239 RepID=UPI0033A7B4D8